MVEVHLFDAITQICWQKACHVILTLFTEFMKSMIWQDAKLLTDHTFIKESLCYIVIKGSGACPGLCNSVVLHNKNWSQCCEHIKETIGHIVELSHARILVW